MHTAEHYARPVHGNLGSSFIKYNDITLNFHQNITFFDILVHFLKNLIKISKFSIDK